ncbi:class I SAM-dependent methyltransferase [Thiohalorhabdus methylotrophus]|uniref:Class I SAM-dependent methyltransferase n=1 Tax=Thiohalorhabdus methylotrophus TaxID=3242694 RepID=A0ABV4TX91_9GAMM
MAAENDLLRRLLADLPPVQDSLAIAPQIYAPLYESLCRRSRRPNLLVPATGEGLGGSPGSAPRPVNLVWGLPETLPFPSGWMDLMALVHPLEYSRSPYQILAEAERVLASNGRLLVLVFNPFSLFGVARSFHRWPTPYSPWSGRFYPGFMVRRMLESTGLAHERSRYLFYRPPIDREGPLSALRFLERLPKRQQLPLGGVACIQARKEEPGLTLLGPAFRAELGRGREKCLPAYSMDREYGWTRDR